MVFKQSFRERARERIENLTDYFAVMRYRMLLDAQIKIAYHWRKRCRIVRRELEEQLAQQKLREEKEKRMKRKSSVVQPQATKI